MFDFYYGNEAEQFSFLRIPKFLFTDSAFVSLSSDAKILYSLMLDRMSLSVKNEWFDEENRVYIIYTHEEAQQSMNCGRDKCTKTFKELADIGLIFRKKRGMGKPDLIYVKNFVSDLEDTELPCAEEKSDFKTTEKPKSRVRKSRSQEYGKTEVLNTEKPKSGVRENRSQEYGKTVAINTDNTKTDFNKTDFNQSYPSPPPSTAEERANCGNLPKKIDRADWTEKIKENISYDILKANYSGVDELVDEITEFIVDVVTGVRKVRVSGSTVPQEVAVNKFLLLNYEHVEYVINNLSELKEKIAKPDTYICTALYNAAYTLNISTFSGFTAATGLSMSSAAKP